MIDPPEVLEIAGHEIAVIHLTIPRSEMPKVIGPALAELNAAVAAQGIGAPGPWFAHHLRTDPARFDFEIGVLATAPVEAVGRVKPGRWPAMTAARTIYRGPFEKLVAAWQEFNDWVRANGHTAAADLWERYLVGPETSSDPADWRTELTRPLIP
jgi:effector-binding domain-containing protein